MTLTTKASIRRRTTPAVWVLIAALAGCGGTSVEQPSDVGAPSGTLTVHAAASLTDAFEQVAAEFNEVHPDVEVVFNFAGTSTLVSQLLEGAPGDIFAAADTANMAKVQESALTDADPVVFATNTAAIVVEKGNPAAITSLADLARPGLKVVLCAVEVPCGGYARRILDNAGLTLEPRSYEESVKAVVSKVALGEADAGIVYATDIAATDSIDGVAIEPGVNIVADYPIAVLAGARNRVAAQEFLGFITSAAGRRILASFGFGPP